MTADPIVQYQALPPGPGVPQLPDPPRLFSGADVVLRPPHRSDVRGILLLSRDPDTIRWTTMPANARANDAFEFIHMAARRWRAGLATLAIEYRGRFSGTLTLDLHNDGAGHLTYVLAPWARGRGIMVRSLRLRLGWSFETPALHIVKWQALEGNWASRRVAQRCGFRITVTTQLDHRGTPATAWTGVLRRGDPLDGRPDHP